jgi:hypothetical protein
VEKRASDCLIANAPNKAAGEAFLDFLLSPAGQLVLLEPGIHAGRFCAPLTGTVARNGHMVHCEY